MARYRLSPLAEADLAAILSTGLDRWGDAGRSRYETLLMAAIRAVAATPDGPLTRDLATLSPSLRAFHTRNLRRAHGVKHPVHIVYYRVRRTWLEIVRVLHDRMDPSLHINA